MRIKSFDRYMLGVLGALLLVLGFIILMGDRIGARVTDFSPTDGGFAAPGAEIRITFNQGMERESIEDNLSITPETTGTIRWRTNTMIFVPDLPLIAGQTYTIELGDDARSLTGRKLNEHLRWTFTTQASQVFYLAPANDVQRSLWSVNSDGTDRREVFAPEYGVFQFASSADGSQIAVTVFNEGRQTADIWLISPDGTRTEQLTDCNPGICGQPAWAPNGDYLAYARQAQTDVGGMAPARVWLWDLSTNETYEVFQDSQVLGFDPIWSPDGTWLSFYDSNATAIRLININTQELRIIGSQLPETWSFNPLNDELIYTDLRQVDSWFYPELYTAPLNEQADRTPFLENPEQDQSPLWSPNGEWIAFRRRFIDNETQGNGSQIMLYHVPSGELRQVTTEANFTNSDVHWSPDGAQFTFQRYELRTADFLPEIWWYDVETEELRLLARDGANASWLGGN